MKADNTVANETPLQQEVEIDISLCEAKAICRLVEIASDPLDAEEIPADTLSHAMHAVQKLIGDAERALTRYRGAGGGGK